MAAPDRAQQDFLPAALPGEAGYGGSETGQVDRPFLILIVDGRAYLGSVATHKNCCCAAYGIDSAICPPTGGRL